nr:CHAP domain-containing protein [Bifidobacterium aemilianum]
MSQISAKWPQYTSYCSTYSAGFQCTWWACMRQKSMGHEITQYMGNGNMWGASAQALGWQQGAAVGGIISFAAGAVFNGAIADPTYGHVAVIEQIDGDTLHLTEGGTNFGKVHTTTLSVSHPPAGVSYWHPGAGGSTPPAPGSDGGVQPAMWECAVSGSTTADVSYDGDGTHASPDQAKAIAREMMKSYKEWNDGDYDDLIWIWNHESGWRWNAENPSSGAYGIPQSLPGSKMASAGPDWHENAGTQIKWGLNYIQSRYGSPSKAKAFWLSHNWY